MLQIKNAQCETVRRSKSLAGLRRHASQNPIRTVAISTLEGGRGLLTVLFHNGDTCQTDFNSWVVLCGFVLRWRSAYYAPLIADNTDRGVISGTNNFLRNVHPY